MQATVSQQQLANAISIAGRAVSTRSTLPVLGNILLEATIGQLKIAATNLEIGLVVWIDAAVTEEGSVTVPARLLADFIERIEQRSQVKLALNQKTQTLNVKAAGATANIKGIDAGDFPLLPHIVSPAPEGSINIAVDVAQLAGMIGRAAIAASNDESRQMLTGIEITLEPERLSMAATDGYQLSVQTIATTLTIAVAETVIAPAKSLLQVAAMCKQASQESTVNIQIATQRNQIIFGLEGNADKTGERNWNTVNVISQLIDGRFPAYQGIIPHPSTTQTAIVVNTGELLKAFRISRLFAVDNAMSARMEIYPDQGLLVVRGVSQDTGDSTTKLDAIIEGEVMTIAFNAKYMIEALSEIDAVEVKIELVSPAKPGVFLCMGIPREEQIIVIMPMEIK